MKIIKYSLIVLFPVLILLSGTAYPQQKIKEPVRQKVIFDSIVGSKNFDELKKLKRRVPAGETAVRMQLKLSKDKNSIKAGDKITVSAQLNRADSNAVYIFTADNKELISSGVNIPQVQYTFFSPGKRSIHAAVYSNNQIVHDSVVVQVKPASQEQTSKEYRVVLSVNNPLAKVDEPVQFEALPTASHERLEYWFNFGDDTITYKSTKPITKYMYKSPSYYTASVRLAVDNKPVSPVSNALVIIEETFSPEVTLNMIDTSAFIDNEVTLIASTNAKGDLEYEFYPGEGISPVRTTKNLIKYKYDQTGEFKTFVKLFQSGKEIAVSQVRTVNITGYDMPLSKGFTILYIVLIAAAIGFVILLVRWLMRPGFSK